MKSLSLILRIVAIIAGITAAVLFFLTQGKLEQKDTALTRAQSSLSTAEQELSETNAQLADTTERLSRISSSESQTKRLLDSANAETSAAKQELSRIQNQLNSANSQISELNRTASQLRDKTMNLEAALKASSDEGKIALLNERISELETANSNLETRLSQAQQDLLAATSSSKSTRSGRTAAASPFPSATIGPETEITSIRSSDGVLTLKNSPEAGMAPGQTLSLVRDYTVLARIQITELKDGFAIGHIKPGSNSKSLSSGMVVNLLY